MKFSNTKLTIEAISLMPATADSTWDSSFVSLSIVGTDVKLSRSYPRFLRDLKNSMLISDDVETLDDPRCLQAIRPLLEGGGSVTGYVRYVKKDQKFTIDADHPAITQENHPQYGVWAIGEEYAYEKDAIHVDKFLIINYGEPVLERVANAQAYAIAKVKPTSAFAKYASKSDASTDGVDDEQHGSEEVNEEPKLTAKQKKALLAKG